MITDIIAYSFAGLFILAFLFLAFRDLALLIRRPAKNMGTGFGRIWAVARTTVHEAWASYAWAIPVLWLIASLIILLAVRPFDETERIALDVRVLLMSQEIIILLMFWVLASRSLPRERECKIVVTNASKPLSRLEIMLGKMTGFSVAALALILLMTLASWAILFIADQRIRSNAREEYTLAENDFKKKSQESAPGADSKKAPVSLADKTELLPPPIEKKRLAEEGSLFAYNNIVIPEDNFSIVGNVAHSPAGKLTRFLKGGSQEQAIYRFTRLVAPDIAEIAPTGQRPYFRFQFPIYPSFGKNPTQAEVQRFLALKGKIVIQVTAVRAEQRLKPQEKMLYLDQDGVAFWEPDDLTELFTLLPDGRDNGEIEVSIMCPTPGVYLQIGDGTMNDPSPDPGDFNVLAASTHAATSFMLPMTKPKLRGFERRDRQQISGPTRADLAISADRPTLECAIYRFPREVLRNVPTDGKGHFKLSMLLDVDKESNPELDTVAIIQAYNDNAPAPAQRFVASTAIIEKRSTNVDLPESLLGGPDVQKRGDLVIILQCQTPGHWLSLLSDSLRIEQPPTPFLINLLKSELILFAEVTLLIVCVAASIRLGWPVAMLTAAFIFFFGSARAFVAGVLDADGLLALGFSPMGEKSGIYFFFNHVTSGLWRFLNFVVNFTPDFTRFDYLRDIVVSRNMPNLDLAWTVLWMGLYALPVIAIGYILFRKQELG